MATPRRSIGTRLTTSSASDGKSSEKPAPIAIAPTSAAPRLSEAAIVSPGAFDRAGADGAPDWAVAVGQPAADDPRRDHGGGEGCEHRRAVTHRALVEVQDDEGRHRGVADDREREPRPGRSASCASSERS